MSIYPTYLRPQNAVLSQTQLSYYVYTQNGDETPFRNFGITYRFLFLLFVGDDRKLIRDTLDVQ